MAAECSNRGRYAGVRFFGDNGAATRCPACLREWPYVNDDHATPDYLPAHEVPWSVPDDLADLIEFPNTDQQQAQWIAGRISPAVGMAPSITLSLHQLVTAAREWSCWQVADSQRDGELDEAEADRVAELATLMEQAVGRLPDTDAGPIQLDLDYADVRGMLVQLVLPGEWSSCHYTPDGIGVEQ